MQTREERVQFEVMAFIMAHGINTIKMTPITAFQEVDLDIRLEVFVKYNQICQLQKKIK